MPTTTRAQPASMPNFAREQRATTTTNEHSQRLGLTFLHGLHSGCSLAPASKNRWVRGYRLIFVEKDMGPASSWRSASGKWHTSCPSNPRIEALLAAPHHLHSQGNTGQVLQRKSSWSHHIIHMWRLSDNLRAPPQALPVARPANCLASLMAAYSMASSPPSFMTRPWCFSLRLH